ncbi:MAG TPA: LamG-like jellyroll fold domain-containing protein [Bacteroidia bacterium]|jgi:hypothetical protein|nr:LamG-like jellyroll fold domain-containing protein [Bacteroidia bacterium]
MIKKLFALTILSCFANLALAQSIPNGGFENWTTTIHKDPQGYFTSNMQQNGNSVAPANVTQDTSHYHGSYSVKLTTILSGTDTVNAFFANGDPSHPAGQGIPIGGKPTGMRLYYKCDVKPGDTSLVLLLFKVGGVVFSQNIQKITGTKTSFTLFSFPLNLALTPDSVIFGIVSSNSIGGNGSGSHFRGIPGTTIQIDSVSFTGIAAQPTFLNGDFENWNTSSTSTLQNWEVSSTNGNSVQTTDAYAGQFALELKTSSTNNAGDTAYTASATTGHNVFNGTVGGYPYSLTTDTLFFNYKYAPTDVNDSAEVILQFKKTGSSFQYYSKLLKASSGYLKVAMGYTLTQTPDSVIVFINSSKKNNVPASYVGADLKIDNIYFKSQGIPAEALNFDGVDDNVSIPNNAALNIINAITIESWIKTTGSPTSEQYIITKNDDSYYVGLNVAGAVGQVSFYLNGVSSSWLYSSSTTLNDNNWHHVGCTYDGSTMSIYVDGALDNSIALTGTINTGISNVYLGSRNNNQFFQGSMDEFRIWNRALCQAEIQNNMNAELPKPQTGLIAYYKFNQGIDNANNTAITSLADSSGNAINGTLNSFALTGTTSNWVANSAVATGNMAPAFTNTISAVATQTNVTCNNGTNGIASVAVTGAAAPFMYTWTSSSSTTNAATGLAMGQYTCNISNSCGVSTTKTFTITQPNPVDVSLSVTGGTITANNATATYQWVDCNNSNAAISGATNQSFTPISVGNYAVEVTQGSCTATSTCTPVSTTGIAKNNANSTTVYPNPFTSELTINSTAKTTAMLFDMLGNKINSFTLQNTTQTISLSDLAPGVYYLQVDNSKIKIIKQ